jgi:hypothetical protein
LATSWPASSPIAEASAGLAGIALAVESREVDREEGEAAEVADGVHPRRREPPAVGQHRGLEAVAAQDPHLLDERAVDRRLVVVDHRDPDDGVAELGELAGDLLVELERHEVRRPGVGRDRAEVAALVADGVGLERDVLEQEPRPRVPRLLDQPTVLGEQPPRRRGELLERRLAERERAQLGVPGSVGKQRSIRQRVVDATGLEVEEGLRSEAAGRGPGARSGLVAGPRARAGDAREVCRTIGFELHVFHRLIRPRRPYHGPPATGP